MRERWEAIRRFTGPRRVAEFRSNHEAAPPSGGSDDAHLTHRHELQHTSLRRSAPDSRHEIREWTHVRCSGSGALLRQNWLFLQATRLLEFASATQRSEFLHAFGTRAVYSTSLAPRNSARCSIVSPILRETSLSPGAPGSAWTELIRSFPFSLSILGSTWPINRSPHRMGST